MPKSDLIELIENRLKVPISLIVLYNKEGKKISFDSISHQQDTQELFLFRRDSIIESCTISAFDWLDYKDFPDIDIYELPFQFEFYERFPQGFEKVPRIEKCLFELYKESKQLYAKFMVKHDFIEKCKTFIEIRLKSSEVLLKNLSLYYKDIKTLWQDIYSRASELQIQYSQTFKAFVKHFESFLNSQSEDPMISFIRQSKIDEFAAELMKKFSKFVTRIHEVKSIVLCKVKQKISSSFADIDKVRKYYKYSNGYYSDFDLKKHSQGFYDLLKVCALYSQCRVNISKIVDKFCRDKRNALNEILSLERQMNKFKEFSIQQARVLADIDLIENAVRECVRRVDELYKEKIILMTSVAAQNLKFKVRSKLVKFDEKLVKFKDFHVFMKIPSNINDAHNAFQVIQKKHEKKMKNIQNFYEKIAFEIIEDNQTKKKFLNGFGKMIPSKFYEGIKTPLLESYLINKILSIDNEPQDKEIEKVQCEKHEIVDYYKQELKAFDCFIQNDIKEYDVRGQKLFDDIKQTVVGIQEIEACLQNNERIIKNVKQELEIVKVIGQENLKNKLMEELQKLKEKEEAFKMIFMEKHKELSDVNSRLRYTVIKKDDI
jgi:hypothetical protein